MLSDEKKKAIANLKTEYEKLIKENNILFPLYKSDAKRLIDIIEEQSEEIEELKEKNRHITKETVDFINSHYIHKDKIKAKIEEFKQVRDEILREEKEFNRPMMTYDLKRNDYCEKMLQSLLEGEE